MNQDFFVSSGFLRFAVIEDHFLFAFTSDSASSASPSASPSVSPSVSPFASPSASPSASVTSTAAAAGKLLIVVNRWMNGGNKANCCLVTWRTNQSNDRSESFYSPCATHPHIWQQIINQHRSTPLLFFFHAPPPPPPPPPPPNQRPAFYWTVSEHFQSNSRAVSNVNRAIVPTKEKIQMNAPLPFHSTILSEVAVQ